MPSMQAKLTAILLCWQFAGWSEGATARAAGVTVTLQT